MVETGASKRWQVAAVNKDDDWPLAVAGKQIDPVAFARTVAYLLQGAMMRLAIGLRIARPAGHNRRIFRHPRAIIVFDLVVHVRVHKVTSRSATPSAPWRISAPNPWSCQETHQFADILRRQVTENVGDP